MFAGQLNKGFRGGFLLLISYFLVTALISFFANIDLHQNQYPDVFYNYFSSHVKNKYLIVSINFIFIGLGVLLVGIITSNQEIVDKQNYFPAFLFLVVSTVAANPYKLTPQIFTNVLVLYAFYKLLNTYRQEDVLKPLFDSAFVLSISFFVTISNIVLLPIFFISLLILRTYNWREWVVSLLGFFIAIFIYECMTYLSDFNQWYVFNALLVYLQDLRKPSVSEYYMALFAILFLLLILALFYNLTKGFGNTVKKQRTKIILLWFLFFSFFGFFSSGASSSSILLSFSLPICFFIGDYLFNLKQLKITNTILTLILICCLVIFLGKLGAI